MKLVAAFALVFLVGSSSAIFESLIDQIAGAQLQALFPGMTTAEIIATYHPCPINAPDCSAGYCCDTVFQNSTVGLCLPTVAPGDSCLVARQCVCGSGYSCVKDGFFGIRGKCLAV